MEQLSITRMLNCYRWKKNSTYHAECLTAGDRVGKPNKARRGRPYRRPLVERPIYAPPPSLTHTQEVHS